MFSSVPGDPEPLPFAAKDGLQYIQISIFLLDVISIHSDGGGGREEVRAASIFIFKAGKPWNQMGGLPLRATCSRVDHRSRKPSRRRLRNVQLISSPSRLALNIETLGLR